MNRLAFFARIGTLALALSAGWAATASATTLNFDDLGTFVDLATVSPYNGFNFTFFTSATSPVAGNFGGGVVSPNNEIFSGGQLNPGAPVDITATIAVASGTFTFNSANMTYGWLPGQQVLVTGFNGVTTVDTTTVTLSAAVAPVFTFNWTGLTSVTFTGIAGTGTSDPFGCGTFNCTQFTIDNFVVNNPVSSAVPEPASWLLLGTGLAAVARRRVGKRA